jgi:hypothetical protein
MTQTARMPGRLGFLLLIPNLQTDTEFGAWSGVSQVK